MKKKGPVQRNPNQVVVNLLNSSNSMCLQFDHPQVRVTESDSARVVV